MKQASDRVRLAPWHEWTLYGVIAVLTLSGIVWVVCHYLLAEQGEYGPIGKTSQGRMRTILQTP